MLNYKKAINEGMRFAIKTIISQVQYCDIEDRVIYVKFKLEQFHFTQIARLLAKYADYYTVEISKENYKTIVIEDDCFKITTSENDSIKINFNSIIHFIDTKQNISIEIEEEQEMSYKPEIKYQQGLQSEKNH